MRILITGIGDAFTHASFGSSALVQGPNGFVLIDCPDPIHRVLKEATARATPAWSASAANINDIIITHLHGDHCNGLESFGFWRRIERTRNPSSPLPRLHVTKLVADRIWQKLAPAMDGSFGPAKASSLADYFDVRILSLDESSSIAGLTVKCRFTKHPVPTVGLLVSDQHATFGWSSDTPFEMDHVNWLNQAELFVHESNIGPAHTPIEDLNALPAAIRNKMRLIHLQDDFDPKRTDIGILKIGDVLSVGESK